MHLDPPIRPPAGRKPVEVLYRPYFFNGGTHITTSHEFFVTTDEQALKIAEGWRDGRKMELWQRARFVKRWD
jgi:hypothetical protein